MIIEPDSCLFPLPQNLESSQALYLEGIRLAIEMVDLSYTRLQETLWYLSLDQPHDNVDAAVTAAFHDSWSIVDSVDRLRGLLRLMPGISAESSTGLAEFLKDTEEVRLLRNLMQHLQSLIPMLVSKQIPIWGILSWFAWTNPEGREGEICSLSAGNLISRQPQRLPIPFNRQIKSRVDMVTLASRKKRLSLEVSLTDVIEHVILLARRIDKALKRAFASASPGAPDARRYILLSLTFQFDEHDQQDAVDS